MIKKYTLLKDNSIKVHGKTLYRVKALRSFSDVKEGDIGGYIETEDNLSHTGNAWVYDEAHVYGNARVYGYACVAGDAYIWGNARVYGYARVSDTVCVYDNARVYGYARVSGDVWVYGYARVYGNARVSDTICVYDNARVYGYARVSDTVCVYDNARVYGNARVSDVARVFGYADICGNARVSGNARVLGNVYVNYPVHTLETNQYYVTILKEHIQIGCKTIPIKDFKALKGRENIIFDMDGDKALKFYKDYYDNILRIYEIELER